MTKSFSIIVFFSRKILHKCSFSTTRISSTCTRVSVVKALELVIVVILPALLELVAVVLSMKAETHTEIVVV